MAGDSNRAKRVADQIQRELAILLQHELKEKKLGLLTVTDVEVSRDLAYAKIFVSLLTTTEQQSDETVLRKQVLDILADSASYFRHQLGQVIRLRSMPQLRFIYDDSAQRGNRIADLINQVTEKDTKSSK